MRSYPKTAVRPIKEVVYGRELIDNYRWLEDPDNNEVRSWVEQQNKFTDEALGAVGFRETFQHELDNLMKTTVVTNPLPVKGRYFWMERKPDEDQFVLYWREGLNGKPVVIFNPNGQSKDNAVSIDYWNFSPKGKYIIFGISEGGMEVSTMHVRELETGKELETIPYTRYAPVRWLPDESGFYYTHLPKPGTVPKQEEQYHTKAYFHKLGTNYENDPMIFGEGRPKEDMIGLTISEDGQYLLISATQKWTENEFFFTTLKLKS